MERKPSITINREDTTHLLRPHGRAFVAQARLESDAKGPDQIRKQVARLEGLLAQKADERSRVVGLYRRGRLSDADLDAQIEEVGREEKALETNWLSRAAG